MLAPSTVDCHHITGDHPLLGVIRLRVRATITLGSTEAGKAGD